MSRSWQPLQGRVCWSRSFSLSASYRMTSSARHGNCCKKAFGLFSGFVSQSRQKWQNNNVLALFFLIVFSEHKYLKEKKSFLWVWKLLEKNIGNNILLVFAACKKPLREMKRIYSFSPFLRNNKSTLGSLFWTISFKSNSFALVPVIIIMCYVHLNAF